MLQDRFLEWRAEAQTTLQEEKVRLLHIAQLNEEVKQLRKYRSLTTQKMNEWESIMEEAKAGRIQPIDPAMDVPSIDELKLTAGVEDMVGVLHTLGA